MAGFPTGTIRLEAARRIFSGVVFEEVKINDKTVGYRATYGNDTYEDSSITAICETLWEVAASKSH